MRYNLGIGFRNKLKTLFCKILAKLQIVLNNSVMYDRKSTRLAEMRMRVHIRRLSMSCPPCMTNSHNAFYCISAVYHIAEFFQTALLFLNHYSFISHYSNAGRIISSIFKLRQPVNQNRRRLLCSNVSNYSAHKINLQKILTAIAIIQIYHKII